GRPPAPPTPESVPIGRLRAPARRPDAARHDLERDGRPPRGMADSHLDAGGRHPLHARALRVALSGAVRGRPRAPPSPRPRAPLVLWFRRPLLVADREPGPPAPPAHHRTPVWLPARLPRPP